MRFRLLGPLEIRDGEDWRGIGAPKWRSVLAALLINAGQIVSADVLINEVWGETPPAKAGNLISIYVLRLRRLLGDTDSTLLVTRAPGYLLRLAAQDTDAQVFEALVREGRRAYTAGDPEQAAAQLAEALALWHGSPLADVPATTLVETEAERLAELRLDAAELRIKAELACGSHAQVIPELRRLLADHPLREGLWLLLMQALDGAGRHAEALDAYGQARTAIADELGVDPGAELRQLYADMLANDDKLAREGGDAPGSISAVTVSASSRPPESAARNEAGIPRLVPVPAQLPADVADFTGRGEQVMHLCDLLSSAGADDSGAVPIALVAGSGGLGKTSLAVHAAHRVRGSFPDGQMYVDLLGATAHPLPPVDVLARFLRDLGVDGRDIPAEDDERAARYRTVMAGRRMLIVLDNARDAAQVRPLLPGAASCAVLITTRSRMPDLASTRMVDLNVLDDDEALALFTRVVGDERAAAEPEATAELLLACAGLPLAIRICAARLATRSGWTIRTMANRLRDEHRRLDELRVGDLAVRASFQVSFASLPTSAQPDGIALADAFRMLGLWHGPSISSAAAAALFGTPEDLGRRRARGPRGRAPAGVEAPRTGTSFTTCFVFILPNGPWLTCPNKTATPRSAAFSAGTCAPPTPRPRHRSTGPLQHPAGPRRMAIRRRSASPAPRRPSPGTTARAPTWSPPPARPPSPACTTSPGGCPLRCTSSSTAAATGRTASPPTASRSTAPAGRVIVRARRGS